MLKKIFIYLFLVATLLFVTGTINLQSPPPTGVTDVTDVSGGILQLLFGDNIASVIGNGILALVLYKTMPQLLAIIKQASASAAEVNDDLFTIIQTIITDVKTIVLEVKTVVNNSNLVQIELLDYIRNQDKMVEARLQIIENKLDILQAAIEDRGKNKN